MHIRDLRERKNLSQEAVANQAGISFSAMVRIEEGRGTQQEWEHVVSTVKEMRPGLRKLGGGPPFKDPVKQAKVEEARKKGRSVAYALGLSKPGRRPYISEAS
jgi:transcriptional regulator with XRE-family HTH domain